MLVGCYEKSLWPRQTTCSSITFWLFMLEAKRITIINIVQGDTKKTVITKNLITSKILFRLTQNFSYIRSSLCSRLLQSFKSVLQKLFVSLALKKCAPNELPGTAGTSGSSRQSSRWPSPWDHSYCCCDCCLQVRDSLGVVATHPVLKVSPHIKIWWVKVRWMRRPLQVTPAAD